LSEVWLLNFLRLFSHDFPKFYPRSFISWTSLELPVVKVVESRPVIPPASLPRHGPQCENWDDITALPEVLRAGKSRWKSSDIEMEKPMEKAMEKTLGKWSANTLGLKYISKFPGLHEF
jgi:hypothetical protein